MAIPETLARKIALFRSQGQLVREGDELFVEIGWFQVLTGQNIVPRGYHPMADQLSREELSGFVGDIETIVAGAAPRLPTHDRSEERRVGHECVRHGKSRGGAYT